jgi:glycosyltransferase involved in cell wall biosynthesis
MQRTFSTRADVPMRKICHIPYGLDTSLFIPRNRSPSLKPFVFGYFGSHAPEKGINTLVRAAYEIVRDDPSSLSKFKVIVWCQPEGQATSIIKRLVHDLASQIEAERETKETKARWGSIADEFPPGAEVNSGMVRSLNRSYTRSVRQAEQALVDSARLLDLVEIRGGYDNRRVGQEVLDKIDCAVIPSISPENYPMTILQVCD